jgi:hypothetical protein
MKYDGMAKAEFQIAKLAKVGELRKDIIRNLQDVEGAQKLPKDELEQVYDELTKEYKKQYDKCKTVLYDSTVPQEYTFKDAKELLGDAQKYEKLNWGEKLNAIRAYAAHCCGRLNVRNLQVYFADYGFLQDFTERYEGSLFMGTDVVGINIKSTLEQIKATIPHECRHYYQYCLKHGHQKSEKNDAIVADWQKGTNYDYVLRPTELDADEFAVKVCDEIFGPSVYCFEKEKKLTVRQNALKLIKEIEQ